MRRNVVGKPNQWVASRRPGHEGSTWELSMTGAAATREARRVLASASVVAPGAVMDTIVKRRAGDRILEFRSPRPECRPQSGPAHETRPRSMPANEPRVLPDHAGDAAAE